MRNVKAVPLICIYNNTLKRIYQVMHSFFYFQQQSQSPKIPLLLPLSFNKQRTTMIAIIIHIQSLFPPNIPHPQLLLLQAIKNTSLIVLLHTMREVKFLLLKTMLIGRLLKSCQMQGFSLHGNSLNCLFQANLLS